MSLVVVVTTTASKDEAARLAALAVEKKLAACAQILAIESVYEWEGMTFEAEWRIELKTTEAAAPALMEKLAAAHSYDEPELIVLPVTASSDGYRRWVEAQVE